MSLRHALLIALSTEACTGYEITQRFANSLGYFWHATHQQIYRELGKMADEGLVRFTVVEQTDKPSKKVYEPTPAGIAELVDWIAQPAPDAPIKDALLMKLFAGYRTNPDVLRAEMERHRATHSLRLGSCLDIERKFFSDPVTMPAKYRYQYLTLQFGIRYYSMWLDWSNEVMKLLDELSKEQYPDANLTSTEVK